MHVFTIQSDIVGILDVSRIHNSRQKLCKICAQKYEVGAKHLDDIEGCMLVALLKPIFWPQDMKTISFEELKRWC